MFIEVDIFHRMSDCECCTPWPLPKLSTSNFTLLYVQNAWKCKQYYRKSGYLPSNGVTVKKYVIWLSQRSIFPSNGTVMNVVLLDLHFSKVKHFLMHLIKMPRQLPDVSWQICLDKHSPSPLHCSCTCIDNTFLLTKQWQYLLVLL